MNQNDPILSHDWYFGFLLNPVTNNGKKASIALVTVTEGMSDAEIEALEKSLEPFVTLGASAHVARGMSHPAMGTRKTISVAALGDDAGFKAFSDALLESGHSYFEFNEDARDWTKNKSKPVKPKPVSADIPDINTDFKNADINTSTIGNVPDINVDIEVDIRVGDAPSGQVAKPLTLAGPR